LTSSVCAAALACMKKLKTIAAISHKTLSMVGRLH
jgi:hypothetical protein